MRKENDFPAKSHCLVRWFGLRSFITLFPAGNNESITTEDRAKMLLSSAAIALNNTNCSIPFFCQLGQRQRKFYSGICGNDSIRTHFEMIHFKDIPNPYRYLSGLLNLFKEKLMSPIAETPPVEISIRFTHALNQWPPEWRHQVLTDEESDDNMETNETKESKSDINSSVKLIWRMTDEPILELQLATTWPSLSEEVIVDSAVHSDLEPFNAPNWSLRILFREKIKCSLSDSISLLLSLKNCWAKNDQILGKLIAESDAKDAEIEFKQALNRLTNPSPLSVNLPQFQSKLMWNRPKWIKEQSINSIFNDKSDYESVDNLLDIRSMKSAPINSLSWRIAITLCNIHYNYKELADIAHMWKEIICQLRHYWEESILLPHLMPCIPNLGMCLLHQKLQMLNCCIEQKIKRESKQNEVKNNDSDDEFYDCNEEQSNDDNNEPIISSKPEGRLSKCGDLKLLNNELEPLYIPITQDPTPMTEDMVNEHLIVLSKLGTSSESASLRARMQSASLLSDMEAFKAANVGSVIEDFVRWHSPRDWIENNDPNSDNGKGCLSPRFQIPGNMWREVWDTAKPIPAHRQKRLFDYTKEAEKVLHYFASLTVTDLIDLLMPVVINCAVIQLIEKRNELNLGENDLPFNKEVIINKCENNEFESTLSLIRDNELKINQFESLIKKFKIANDLEIDPKTAKTNSTEDIRKFVFKLMNEPEVEFSSYGYFGKLVRRMFLESQLFIYESNTTVGERDINEEKLSVSKLPNPIAKEFIFRVSLPRPNSYSREVPQRMYCALSAGEFRIAGAFSEDITYF